MSGTKDDAIINNHQESGNWAGYVLDGGPWTGVDGVWTQNQDYSAGTQAESTWVGIGGDQGDQNVNGTVGLIQAGTLMQNQLGYTSWFEWVNNVPGNGGIPQQGADNPYGVRFSNGSDTVRPGDQIEAQVYWSTRTVACFVVDDSSRATGSFSACLNVGNYHQPYDTYSAEWIAEAPTNATTGALYPLSNFGDVMWSYEEVFNPQTGETKSFTQEGGYIAYIMRSAGNPVPPCSNAGIMAYPENASGATSDTLWCRAG
jgi:hypothetical protein